MRLTAIVATALSIAACATISPMVRNQIRIDNGVSNCLKLEVKGVRYSGQVVLADLEAIQTRPLSSCGCRSKVLAYHVLEQIGDGGDSVELERGFGRILARDQITVVVASDVAVLDVDARLIRISCALAD